MLFSSGRHKLNHSIVAWMSVHQKLARIIRPIQPHMPVIKSNASAYRGDLSVVKMAVLVAIFIFFSLWTCQSNIHTDISDFLTEEIKGPAKFSCKSGEGCKFEEPAMNQLIDQVFGDSFITLQCDGGECLHYSQVPGYVVCLMDSHITLSSSDIG